MLQSLSPVSYTHLDVYKRQILDRDQTLFPDTVDQTVYPIEFEHATPTSGTLTSSCLLYTSSSRPSENHS